MKSDKHIVGANKLQQQRPKFLWQYRVCREILTAARHEFVAALCAVVDCERPSVFIRHHDIRQLLGHVVLVSQLCSINDTRCHDDGICEFNLQRPGRNHKRKLIQVTAIPRCNIDSAVDRYIAHL